ncbi:hypothetical protein [Streptomyces inhibens]|uniref:hypothetical protein n=1 Tax=Streptomyces inhibens TaxID=2293571 RepID=UPI001FD36270|nr:hypothetical protein [Streptomyces inhibens]
MNERIAPQPSTTHEWRGAATSGTVAATAGRGLTGIRGRSRRQVCAVLLVVFGGYILPVAGWLIGGVVWLVTPGWSARVKTAGLLVWPLCTLGLVATSAATYWLILPLGDPVSSIATSLFLLVPSSWFLLLLTAAWMLLGATSAPRDVAGDPQ